MKNIKDVKRFGLGSPPKNTTICGTLFGPSGCGSSGHPPPPPAYSSFQGWPAQDAMVIRAAVVLDGEGHHLRLGNCGALEAGDAQAEMHADDLRQLVCLDMRPKAILVASDLNHLLQILKNPIGVDQ